MGPWRKCPKNDEWHVIDGDEKIIATVETETLADAVLLSLVRGKAPEVQFPVNQQVGPPCLQYPDVDEIVPGVFVAPGDAIYIADEAGEIATWNCDEIREDVETFTSALIAAILAAKYGPGMVRRNIESRGRLLAEVIKETAKRSGG